MATVLYDFIGIVGFFFLAGAMSTIAFAVVGLINCTDRGKVKVGCGEKHEVEDVLLK